jgi:Na+/melibiose symporter-like transporter
MADSSIWRNRDFMLLWVAQAISQTAQNAVNYGLLVLVQTRSHSSAHMSVAVLTVILPSVIFGLVAGAYVDRRDKRWVLIGTNALRAVCALGYVLFADHLFLVYLTNFLFSTISQFFAPAEAAMIPSIVERRRLIQANSLFHLTFTASQLGGLVLLGPLVVNLVGLEGLFVTVGLALVICAALLWPLPSTHRRVADQIEGFAALWGEVRDVLTFVRSDRILSWAVVQWTLAATLALVLATLAPAFVVDILGIRAEDSVFILAPAGIGMILGTGLLSRLAHRLDKHRAINSGVFAIGLALSLLSVTGAAWEWLVGIEIGLPVGAIQAEGHPNIPEFYALVGVVMLTAAAAGLAFVAVVVPSQTIIQERAPVEIRGRVFAVQLVLSNVVGIAPLIFLGDLADRIGVDWTLLLLGLAICIFGVLSARLAPSDRRIEEGPAAESSPAA